MPSLFIGVYQALYPYAPQSDQELAIDQGDLLYLLEKSTDDDWWTVKKRELGLDTEEPTGLVPNNYIQQAPVVSRARALYDYDRQTDEELSFKEDEVFDVYDANDQDWILVGLNSQEFGFVPSNYIENIDQPQPSAAYEAPQLAQQQPPQQQQQPAAPQQLPPTLAPTAFPPPPQHPSAAVQYNKPLPTPAASDAYSRPPDRSVNHDRQISDDEDYEQPPPKPARPMSSGRSNDRDGSSSSNRDKDNGEKSGFFSWQVQEVDGRKKHKATLAIGNGMIMYSPEKSAAQQWDISDLVNYSLEKKHVFLDFKNPTSNLDLHAGSKETAETIMSAIGEVAGASKAMGLREVYMAANSAGQQIGKVLYNFEAQGDDEVTAREGDNVFIIDSTKSDQWWMVRNNRGEEGVMPSSYIEVGGRVAQIPASSSASSHNRRQSASKLSRKKSHSKRDKSSPQPPSKPKPDMSKVRTWTDRSGTFKVDAALLGCADGKIHLHKTNGVKIAVAAGKMSVEDLEYIEGATGVTLDDDKPLVDVKRNTIRKPKENRGVPGGPSTGTGPGSSNHVPKPSSNQSIPSSSSKPQSDYDWFGFFLDCGVDVNNCQRYAINFSRDQMDESVLEEITPQVLRNLGLKEGDILRVTKKLDEKFSRRTAGKEGGLFSEAGGVLKNNTTRNEPKEQPKSLNVDNGFEDDAWAVKSTSPGNSKSPEPPAKPPRPSQNASPNPAVQSQPQPPQLQQPQPQQPQPQQPQPTGALADLLTMQPLQPVKTATTPDGAPAPTAQPPRASTMPAQPIQSPIYTGNVQQNLTGNQPLQQNVTGGAMQPLGPFATGNSQQPLGPFATGNAQQSSFATGVQQPFGTGASMASSMANIGAPPNSMNAQMAALTGQQQPQMQMGMPMQMQQQQQQPMQMQMQQPMNGFMQQQQPQQPSPYMQQQPSYSTPNITGLTNQFQQASLTGGNGMMFPQQQQQLPQQQQPMMMQQQPQQMGQQPLQGQPTGFGFGNQPTGGFQTAAQALSMDANSQYSPLQPQRTGPPPPVSFGEPQALQKTPTGRRANLSAATPTNPFGF